jgi:uncharacterized protein
MAIALADVASAPILTQAIVLVLVGVGITIGVYGFVGLIVKMDDIGLHLAQRRSSTMQWIGRGLVTAMPVLMSFLSAVGTAAMIWVGGGILVYGAEKLGLADPADAIHHAAEVVRHASSFGGSIAAWATGALGAGLIGLVIGGLIASGLHQIRHRKH